MPLCPRSLFPCHLWAWEVNPSAHNFDFPPVLLYIVLVLIFQDGTAGRSQRPGTSSTGAVARAPGGASILRRPPGARPPPPPSSTGAPQVVDLVDDDDDDDGLQVRVLVKLLGPSDIQYAQILIPHSLPHYLECASAVLSM